jgi:glucose-6-phosphate 1-dehydrogenase
MLFRDKLIPEKTFIYGYSRSKLTMEQLKSNVAPYLKVRKKRNLPMFTKLFFF